MLTFFFPCAKHVLRHHRKPTDVPAIFSEALGRAQLDKDRDTDAYLRQHLLLTTGMMLGLGGTFCREPQMPPLSVVVRNTRNWNFCGLQFYFRVSTTRSNCY